MQTFDAVVVGAGPAGLAAAAELSRQGSCLVVERGPLAIDRRRDDPEDVLCGVGGAGLYSDGKHSFWPSATALWTLPDRPALGGAFAGTAELLRTVGVEAGDLPDRIPAAALPSGRWQEKRYPSIYVPFDARLALIERLWAGAGERRAGAVLRGAGRAGDELGLDLCGSEVRTRQLVVATGRWSPPAIRPWLEGLGARYVFRRVDRLPEMQTSRFTEPAGRSRRGRARSDPRRGRS